MKHLPLATLRELPIAMTAGALLPLPAVVRAFDVDFVPETLHDLGILLKSSLVSWNPADPLHSPAVPLHHHSDSISEIHQLRTRNNSFDPPGTLTSAQQASSDLSHGSFAITSGVLQSTQLSPPVSPEG